MKDKPPPKFRCQHCGKEQIYVGQPDCTWCCRHLSTIHIADQLRIQELQWRWDKFGDKWDSEAACVATKRGASRARSARLQTVIVSLITFGKWSWHSVAFVAKLSILNLRCRWRLLAAWKEGELCDGQKSSLIGAVTVACWLATRKTARILTVSLSANRSTTTRSLWKRLSARTACWKSWSTTPLKGATNAPPAKGLDLWLAFMGVYKEMRSKRNHHHLVPKSRRNSSNESWNLLLFKVDRHESWHRIFGNRTLDEVIRILQRVRRAKQAGRFRAFP